MDAAEVGVGAGGQRLGGRPRLALGGVAVGAVAQLAGVEGHLAVGERVGDARLAVAGRFARGDRVVDRLRVHDPEDVEGVVVDEGQRLAGVHDGQAPGAADGGQVALAVDEVVDRHLAHRPRGAQQLERVGQPGPGPAVVAVLRQRPVGEHALGGIGLRERVHPAPSLGHRDRHDRHRLVPGGPARVVGAGHRDHVAGLDVDPPVGGRHRHRHVPGHRTGRLVVLRVGAEQELGDAVARDLQVVVEAAGVQVPPHEHQRLLAADGPPARVLDARVGGVVGIRVAGAAGVTGALDGVEDGVAAADHVQPLRVDRLDPRRLRRGGGHEVEVVGDVDRGRVRREVVDHVVHLPPIRGAVRVAVAGRHDRRRLLLARRPGRAAVDHPDGVVQVHDVHPRDRAVLVDQVRLEAGEVAVLLGAHRVGLEEDGVLPRVDLHRAVDEVHVLHPVLPLRHRRGGRQLELGAGALRRARRRRRRREGGREQHRHERHDGGRQARTTACGRAAQGRHGRTILVTRADAVKGGDTAADP